MMLRIAVTLAFLMTANGAESVKTTRIKVAAGADGVATEIPVTVVQGAKPGKTLAVICGMSGTEYQPIVAMNGIVDHFKPSEMSGKLLLVHVANPLAFESRSIYRTPADRKELAMVFPGSADGTITERIAWALTNEVVAKADYVVNLRAGGSNELLQPFVLEPATGDKAMDDKIHEAVLSFGPSLIAVDKLKPSAKTFEAFVAARGTPVFTVYAGSMGIIESRLTDMLQRGVHGVLAQLNMEPGKPPTSRGVNYFDGLTTVESPGAGVSILYALRGQHVKAGDPLFGVADLFGKNSKIVKSPVDGYVLRIVATLPLDQGQQVVVLGKERE